MNKLKQLLLLVFLSIWCNVSSVSASHILGGEMTHEYLGNHTYFVKLKVYRDCNNTTQTMPNTMQIDVRTLNLNYVIPNENLSLKSVTDVTPVCATEPTVCSGGANAVYGVEAYIYEDTLTNIYTDSIPNAQGVMFYWEYCCYTYNLTSLTDYSNDIFLYSKAYYYPNTLNNFPSSAIEPIHYTCVGKTMKENVDITDIEGDSLVFSLTSCPESFTLNPTTPTPLSYNSGFSGTQPLSTSSPVTINPVTGTIEMIPTVTEVGIICIRIEEYRNGVKLSERVNTSIINTLSCSNASPLISGINGTASSSGTTSTISSITMEATQQTCFDIQVYDGSSSNTVINHFSTMSGATYNITSMGTTKTLTVCWTPTMNDIGRHRLLIDAEDTNCPVSGKSRQGYEVKVERPHTLEGNITKPDGSVLTDAAISLYDSVGVVLNTQNTTNGFYQFILDDNDLNKSYYVGATPDAQYGDLGKTYFGDVPVLQYATLVTNNALINTANIQVLDSSTITGNGQLSGFVSSNATGSLVTDVRVVLVDSVNNYIKESTSDVNGTVSFYGLPEATYYVWVDDWSINNDTAPSADLITLSIRDSVDFILHNTFLELVFPPMVNTNLVVLNNKIQLTPNPTNGLLNLRFPINTTEIQVLDINGKMLQQQILENKKTTMLDLSGLPNQVYFVRFITNKGIVTKKIYKQH